jgi:hypothetical protein
MKPDQGIPLDRFLLLPLDITTPHELPFPVYQTRVDPAFETTARPSVAIGKTPLQHFTSSFLERTREIMLQFGKDAMEVCVCSHVHLRNHIRYNALNVCSAPRSRCSMVCHSQSARNEYE